MFADETPLIHRRDAHMRTDCISRVKEFTEKDTIL
jgi:hypothetical protein